VKDEPVVSCQDEFFSGSGSQQMNPEITNQFLSRQATPVTRVSLHPARLYRSSMSALTIRHHTIIRPDTATL